MAQPYLLRSFECSTLQNNWWEDRIQASEDVKLTERSSGVRTYEPEVTRQVPPSNCEQPLAAAPHLVRYADAKSERVVPQHDTAIKHTRTDIWETTTQDALRPKVDLHKPPALKDIAASDTLARRIPKSDWTPPPKPTPTFETAETTSSAFHTVSFLAHKNDALPEQGDDTRIMGGFPACKIPTQNPSQPVYSHTRQFSTSNNAYYKSAFTFGRTAEGARNPGGRAGTPGPFSRKPEQKPGVQIYRDDA